jgi:maltooligosyltrehalose trehalohydrolase
VVVSGAVAWALDRGAQVRPDGSVRFRVWAPAAAAVAVRVGAGAAAVETPLAGARDQVREAVVSAVAPGSDYCYRLDGRDRPDPVSRHQPAGVHGPSRVVDPAAFRWSDGAWRGRAMADLVLYELHVGTFTAAGTFDAMVERLAALRALGVTAIELMPVAEFPGARNWGYDGVHLYAPQSTYGGPDGLRRLVDAAHAADLAVVLDVVYNHLGPEGNYLGEYGPYFTERYRTPWGPALNFDDADSDEVRRFFVDNARYWVTEFHLDGLRLDAVHAICDCSATHLLEEIGDAVHAQAAALGRTIVVIAESDGNDPRLLHTKAAGGFGLDGQWSDDFHHAVHAALTGERGGYYVDFGGAAPVAKALRDRFVYDGGYSAHRRRRHGRPAADIAADCFVVCTQNHDQVGNRARGERLAALVPFEARKLAAALLLLSPYVPLLFMGEEYGETTPFLYFVSHGDAALVEAVRAGRQREFAAFAWGSEIPDPQAEETFRRSRPVAARAHEPGHAALRALYGDLLRLRHAEPALRPGAAAVTVADGSAVQASWVTAVLVPPAGPALLGVFNLGAATAEVPLPAAPAGRWRLALATTDARYDGDGVVPVATPPPATAITIAGHAGAAYGAG